MFGRKDKRQGLTKKLLKAVRTGNLDVARRLLEEGAYVDGNKGGQNPLHLASYYGHVECVRLLLEKGATVDARNSAGCTALMGAAERGRTEIVGILLAAGADASLRGKDKSAIDWATMNAHWDVAKILLSAVMPKPVESADEVTFERQVSNRTLEEVFNFAALERVSLIRKSPQGAVESLTREKFSEIGDKETLRRAFEEHVRRGGKTEESKVFPNVLSKPKPPSKG